MINYDAEKSNAPSETNDEKHSKVVLLFYMKTFYICRY